MKVSLSSISSNWKKEDNTYKNLTNGGWVMVFNATFNNTSVILWRSVLLVEETGGVPGENHKPAASNW